MSATTPDALARPHARATTTYRWVRQVHLWVGAWGALAAILFGFTGLVMNHRFGAGAWPQGEARESARLSLTVPKASRASPEALAAWLQQAHGLRTQQIKKPKPDAATLSGVSVPQPDKWTLSGGSASRSWSLEYVAGNAHAEVKRSGHTLLAALNRLHKGYNDHWAWGLLADSFAVGMMLLGLSGLWMWARGRTPREMALSVFGLASLLFAVLVGVALA